MSKGFIGTCFGSVISITGYFQLKNPYSSFYKFSTKFLNKMEPENSHKIVEFASYLNLLPKDDFEDERLRIDFENINLMFKNPIGLAAGFDKNGKLYSNLKHLGNIIVIVIS